MIRLEIIRIRLFMPSDTEQVTRLFQQFVNKTDNKNIRIALLKNKNVENDWSIHLEPLKESADKDVSSLTILLCETFQAIGMVCREVLTPVFQKEI